MGRFDNIKTAIDANIKTNGNQAITGAVLNTVMKQTVDSVDTELTELESETSIKTSTLSNINTLIETSVLDGGDGYYIGRGSTLNSRTSAAVSNPIPLKKGESISVVATLKNDMAAIATKIGTRYAGLVYGATEDYKEQTCTYLATEDIEIYVSYRKDYRLVVYKVESIITNLLKSTEITEGYILNLDGTFLNKLGYYNANDGVTFASANTRRIMEKYLSVVPNTRLRITSDYTKICYWYGKNKEYLGYSNYYTKFDEVDVIDDAYYLRLGIGSDSDIVDFNDIISVYRVNTFDSLKATTTEKSLDLDNNVALKGYYFGLYTNPAGEQYFTKLSSTSYSIYGAYRILKGTKIKGTLSAGENLSIISIIDNGFVQPLLYGNKYGSQSFEYVAEKDMDIFISGKNDAPHEVSIILSQLDEYISNFVDKTPSQTRENMFGEFFKIAYSSLLIGYADGTPIKTFINTQEHFLTAVRLGFDALKADMQITSDGKVILCHDAGFTFDSNGRITYFDSGNYTPISSLTYEQIMSFEYGYDYYLNGIYSKVCDLETFLQICCEYNIIPYLTLRSYNTEETAQEALRLLKKYNLTTKAIINSYGGIRMGATMRALDKDVWVDYTLNDGTYLTRDIVDSVISMGNASINMNVIKEDAWSQIDSERTQDAILYAKEKKVRVGCTPINNVADFRKMLSRGYCHGQVYAAIFDTTPKHIDLTIRYDADKKEFSQRGVAYGKYDFQIEQSENSISLYNIKKAFTNSYFNNGVLEYWFNLYLPYTLSIHTNAGNLLTARWDNNKFIIDGVDFSKTQIINFSIVA